MSPRLTLLRVAPALVVAVLGAAPLPALAQAWPATVVASAPHAAPTPRRPLVVVRKADTSLRRQAGIPPSDPISRSNPLKLSGAEAVPDVDLRPKAEWSDDQGWRASPTRIAYKRRF